MRRLLVAVLLLVTGLAASADTTYVEEQHSGCYSCHGPGQDPNPMAPAFTVDVAAPEIPTAKPFDLRAVFTNTWLAQNLDMYVTLDLREAPSLAFTGSMAPVDVVKNGNTSAGVGPALEQRGAVDIDVPAGVSDLRITLEPAQRGALGPDLSMHVHGSRSGKVDHSVDAAGPGASEVQHMQSASEIAALGYGTWRIEARHAADPGSGDLAIGAQAFTVRMQAWANTSLERQKIAFREGPVDPGAKQTFAWPVILEKAPGPAERILLVANATIYYEHPPGINDDIDHLSRQVSLPLRPQGAGAAIGVEGVPTIQVPTVGVSMASVSEAVGYASAMLLVTSMVTGGMFGKASRRHLNLLFGSARRRVAFHNFLSYGIVAAALAHMTLFIIDAIEPLYPWQRGVLWGGTGILCMLGLGFTGALQVAIIRRWDYATWRRVHLALALATVAFTVIHMLLDGAHFGGVQESLGWEDPLVPEGRR